MPHGPNYHQNPKISDGVIGLDSLRSATFSWMTMDAQTGEVSVASVQIGDPITEKGLINVLARACGLDFYNDITDCGAGGSSSAVGEMSSKLGCDVELTRVRLLNANTHLFSWSMPPLCILI